MKKLFFPLVFLAMSFTLLSACNSEQTAEEEWEPTEYESVDTLDDVTMNVRAGTLSPTGVTVALQNDSDKHCIFSEDFLLEKKVEGEWYKVPILPSADYGFEEPGYELGPSDVSDWTAEWEWLYGKLDSGEYRIVKSLLDVREPGDYDTHHLAAEFTID